jgi:cellobiose-specific phosphotransferase system component IIC
MMKKVRLVFWGVLLLVVVVFALHEYEILPIEYVGDGQVGLLYILDMLSLICSLGGTFVVLKLMALERVRRQISTASEEKALQIYAKWANIRSVILGIMLLVGIVVYYATSYQSSAKYCVLISLIAVVFCMPGQSEFDRIYTLGKSKKEQENNEE